MTTSSSVAANVVVADAIAPEAPTLTTNAVNRTLSDIHAPTWLALLGVNISARTIFFHPLNLAIARKRVTSEPRPPGLFSFIAAAYRGGELRIPTGGGSPVYNTYQLGAGGLRGSYRGLGAALTCNLVGEIAYLFTLETLKERMTKGGSSKSGKGKGGETEEEVFEGHSGYAAVGAMCGDVVSLVAVTPLVIAANRQMTAQYGLSANNTYRDVRTTMRAVWNTFQTPSQTAATAATSSSSHALQARQSCWRTRRSRLVNGLRGLYQGTSAGLLRIPASGCWWALYTKSKEELYVVCGPQLEAYGQRHAAATAPFHQHEGREHTSLFSSPTRLLFSRTDNPVINGAASAIASTITTLLFNPLAVIQTRQQTLPAADVARLMQATTRASPAAPPRGSGRLWRLYASSFKKTVVVAQALVREEGVRAFFKGATANVGVAVFDGIIFSLIFELTKLSSDLQYLSEK